MNVNEERLKGPQIGSDYPFISGGSVEVMSYEFGAMDDVAGLRCVEHRIGGQVEDVAR